MEGKRILDVYQQRGERARDREPFFGYEGLSQFFRAYQRYRSTLLLLNSKGIHSLSVLKILDVGCGNGNMLRQFLQWEARPENLAGIELRSEPVAYALALNPNLDIRCGSATNLPWAAGSFDLVCQHTVFTSILDPEMKKEIADEMLRVLKTTGYILWYDFWLNPTNPQTRAIRPAEIKRLFPNCHYEFRKITLAPPIERRVVPTTWGLASFLESLKLFNTHYLALIQPQSA